MKSEVKVDTTGGANGRQVGGDHYSKYGGLQHWDVVKIFKLDYFQGQITKYVMRFRDKNGIQDLEKAKHFLEKLIEVEKTKDMQTCVAVFSVQMPTGAPDPCSQSEADQKEIEQLLNTPPEKIQTEPSWLLKDFPPTELKVAQYRSEGDMYTAIDDAIYSKYPDRDVKPSNPKDNNGEYSPQWKIIGCVYYYQYNSKIMAIRVPHLKWYFARPSGFKMKDVEKLCSYIDLNSKPKQ